MSTTRNFAPVSTRARSILNPTEEAAARMEARNHAMNVITRNNRNHPDFVQLIIEELQKASEGHRAEYDRREVRQGRTPSESPQRVGLFDHLNRE